MEPKKSTDQPAAGLAPMPSNPHPSNQSLDGVVSHPAHTMQPPQATPPTLPEAQNTAHSGQFKSFLTFVAFIGGVLLAAFLINQFIFQSYYVDGSSMVPTLQNGDRLIIEKVGKTAAGVQSKPYIPERGQIVVLDSSLIAANGSQEQLIKRVIGLPGDTINIKDGVVTIKNKDNPNGFDVDKQLGLTLEPTYSSMPQEYTVPEGRVFVMGDNRTQNGSHDSRAFGTVEAKDLEGHLWARILPINHAQVYP